MSGPFFNGYDNWRLRTPEEYAEANDEREPDPDAQRQEQMDRENT